MKKSYFPEEGVWLKGNIHSHSSVSDGLFTPKELAELYASHGYAFLSMTDHNVLVAHSELPEEEIILLTGLEHDIEYSADKCTHVVGNSAAGKNTTDYLCKRYSSRELTDQQLVDLMRGDGQFVSLAHPVWSRMEVEEILGLENIHAIEVFNNGTEHLCHGGNAEVWWDMLLRRGKKVFATAVDDVHVADDLFGGWVWVKAADRSREAIMEALFNGAFYASTGPVIHDFGVEDGQAYVSCSDCREIHFVTYPPRGDSFFAEEGVCLKEGTHTLTGREAYVRAVCVDSQGRWAWSNPIFFDERA
jgi:hypothetical protein